MRAAAYLYLACAVALVLPSQAFRVRNALVIEDGNSSAATVSRLAPRSQKPRGDAEPRAQSAPAPPSGVTGTEPRGAADPTSAARFAAQMLLPLQSFVSVAEAANYDNLLVVIFVVAFAVVCLSFWLQPSQDVVKAREEVVKMRRELMEAYNVGVAELDLLFSHAASDAAHLAERVFQEKRLQFGHFLDHFRSSDKQFFGPLADEEESLQALRDFVALWYLLFSEHVIEDTTLDTALGRERADSSMNDVRSMQSERQAHLAQHVTLALKKFGKQQLKELCDVTNPKRGPRRSVDAHLMYTPHEMVTNATEGSSSTSWISFRRSCGCGFSHADAGGSYPVDLSFGCLRLTFLSPVHIFRTVATCFGLGVVGLLVWRSASTLDPGAMIVAAVSVVIEVLMLWMLMAFHEVNDIAAVEHAIVEVKEQTRLIEQERNDFVAKRDFMEHYHTMWTKRTLPCLDLYEAMHMYLDEHPRDERLALMQEFNKRFKTWLLALGDIEHWSGDRAERPELLEMVTQQVRSATEFFKNPDADGDGRTYYEEQKMDAKAFLDEVFVFGFIVIKIVCARGLSRESLFKKGEPLVVLTMSPSGEQQRTTVKEYDDPIFWKESFFFPLRSTHAKLAFQVCSNDVELGRLSVPLGIPAGQWLTVSPKPLLGKDGKKHGMLEYHIYLASEVRHLRQCPSPPGSKRQRKSTFHKRHCGDDDDDDDAVASGPSRRAGAIARTTTICSSRSAASSGASADSSAAHVDKGLSTVMEATDSADEPEGATHWLDWAA